MSLTYFAQEDFVNGIELAGPRGEGRGGPERERRPLLARYLAPRQLVVSTAPTEKHARLSLESAGTRIIRIAFCTNFSTVCVGPIARIVLVIRGSVIS
ncbi:unnamed protein product, partial [Iphiclides podalirius]